MNSFIHSWWDWSLCEILLFLFWGAYRILLKFKISSADRYLYLKSVFILAPVLPLLTRLVSHLPFEPNAPLISAGLARIHHLSTTFEAAHAPFGRPYEWILYVIFSVYAVAVLRQGYKILFSFIRLNSISDEAEPIESNSKWQVVVHRLKIPPATIGWIQPRILIPNEVYRSISKEQLDMILKHESVHIERRDYFFNAVRVVVQAFLVQSPFTWLLGKHFEEDQEISCDDRLRFRHAVVPRQYGELLMQLVKTFDQRPELSNGGLFVSNSLITKRISAMTMTSKGSKPALTLVLFVVFSVMFASGISALGVDTATNSNAGGWVSNKDLTFNVWGKVESQEDKQNEKNVMVTRAALNWDETGTLVMENRELRLTPHRKGDSAEIALQVWDKTQQKTIYDSVAPLVGNSKIDFQSEFTVAEGTYLRFHVQVTQILPTSDRQ